MSTYSDWVKCTKKYAEKGLTSENVEKVCEKKGFVFGCPPKCEHEALFYQGEPPCACKKKDDLQFTWPLVPLSDGSEHLDIRRKEEKLDPDFLFQNID